MSQLIEKKIKELPIDLLIQIPEKYRERNIFLTKDYSKTRTGSEVIRILNRRYIFTQLGLELQETDHREIFYMIRKKFAKEDNKLISDEDLLDISGDFDQQYISITGNMIEGYYRKLAPHLGFKYWGFVMEYLNISSQGVAKIFDLDLNEYVVNLKTLHNVIPESVNIPFFLIICEKKMTVDITMKGLIEKGYDKGYYGITLSRFATTHVIKYLIELAKLKRLYIFVLHDFDLSGLMIYFNIRKWIDCESVGINPDFLREGDLDFEQLFEFYKPKNKNKLIKGARGMIKTLDISEKEKVKYNEWLELCLTRRIELNSLTALREIEDYKLNKARDFVDYIIKKAETKIWDLNRYKKPKAIRPDYSRPYANKPSYIHEIIEEIKEKATEEINKYLESINLKYDSQWQDLIKEDYNKMIDGIESVYKIQERLGKIKARRIQRKNKRYSGSLLSVDQIIRDQKTEIYNLYRKQTRRLGKIRKRQKRIFRKLIEKTPEFKETKNKLEEIKGIVINALENINYGEENENKKSD